MPTADGLAGPAAGRFCTFRRSEWSKLRGAHPLTIREPDLEALRGVNVPLAEDEVKDVYLPLSRLLSLHAGAVRASLAATAAFLGTLPGPIPFVVGIAGSVAVGKSTMARLLQELLRQWPGQPSVDLVATDGFLLPNRVLEERGCLERKGFPETYDQAALVRFLTDLKAGAREVTAPVYSHEDYDIVPGVHQILRRPDIVIIEGLNVLQAGMSDPKSPPVFVSDFFDFSIYLDAEEGDIERWFVDRVLTLRTTAFRSPRSYFARLAALSRSEVAAVAADVWQQVNGRNLRENIAPTKGRANLIIHKGPDHAVDRILLRCF